MFTQLLINFQFKCFKNELLKQQQNNKQTNFNNLCDVDVLSYTMLNFINFFIIWLQFKGFLIFLSFSFSIKAREGELIEIIFVLAIDI